MWTDFGPDPEGNFYFNFYFDLKYSWEMLVQDPESRCQKERCCLGMGRTGGLRDDPGAVPRGVSHVLLGYDTYQGPEKDTNIKEYFPKTGFDVLPAVPGHRATSHD